MASANSGSLQSSSGGDDEYFDSRVDSLSAFFRSSSAAGVTLPPPPLSYSSSDGYHLFDYPSLPYLDFTTPLLPHDSPAAPWHRPLLNSSSSNCTTAAGSQSSSSPVQQPLDQPVATTGGAAGQRSSKKRSRASRRAPTTVLNTDTSNFRAMVQEFTGIPSPPFAAAFSSPFVRSRFDLFHSAAATFHSSSADTPTPPFLLRPFPQKDQSPSLPTITTNPISFSSPHPSPLCTTNTTAANANSSTPTDNNYQLPSVVSPQSPILNFQSLLQPSLLQAKYTLPAMPTSFSGEPHSVPLAEYGANAIDGLPKEFVGFKATRSSWPDGGADLAQFRPAVAGDYSGAQQQVGSSHKPNYSASGLLQLNGEKASESIAATRGEGMVESWIHSSE